MPRLVEFRIGGEIGLGHQPQQPPLLADGGAVVQNGAHGHRQADDKDGVRRRRFRQQKSQRLLRPPQQRGLEKQIPAGVAGDAKLREHQQSRVRRGAFDLRQDLPGVVMRIRHPDVRGSGRDA